MASEAGEKHYSIDVDRMIDRVLEMPDQMRQAWELAGAFAGELSAPKSQIVICGMGGSAVGGRLLKDLIGREKGALIHLERGYLLPATAGTDTKVICVSYSGNTEEVISTFRDGLSKGCEVSVITSGGILMVEAVKAGVPLLKIPGGIPPRAAIGFLFTPLLRIVVEWGLFSLHGNDISSATENTESLLDRCRPDADLAGNSALQLAHRLYGKVPLIYSGDGLLSGISYRWKCQLNENSKCMAFSNTFPELGHNEIMGWECPEKLRQDIFLIMLRDGDDHPRVQKRMDVTRSILEPLAGGFIGLESDGGAGEPDRLSRLLSMLAMADLTSVYLAVEYGRDPTPIGKIEEIKKKLGSED
ncbi:MAG: bifunctional phosphoglucose/phosphomannose isomerase [Bacteroidales bacterium]|nr:bifunctional phosphoglucose/phosphomannose isomerase [Candidatus Latescibacterota bacterium]